MGPAAAAAGGDPGSHGEVLLNGPEVRNNLPALGLGQAGPGGHAMTEIALAEKPFNIAVICRTDMLAPQRRPLVPVPLRV